ncbi:MAG: TerB family tellurite resistance protein [Candidatus Electryonea clarkiae]|nr:TerB family tellurite resistance protein [Candidatus Electryonea clarkiae]MDP8286781.1 TerB family tellurite resistance protein [Candidatus Electryonea clarkiae]
MFLFARMLTGLIGGALYQSDYNLGTPSSLRPGQDRKPFITPEPSDVAIGDFTKTIQALCSVSSFLAHLAKADGLFGEDERELILEITTRLAKHTLNLEILGKNDTWQDSIKEALDDEELPETIIKSARNNRLFRQALISFAWRLAARDGKVTNDEVEWISKIAIEMGANMLEVELSSLPYYRTKGEKNDLFEAKDTLGIQGDVSPEDIEEAYQSVCREYDPERQYFTSDEENEKLSRIFAVKTEAYHILKGIDVAEELFGMINIDEDIQPVTGNEDVLCFVCGEPNKLPENENIDSARCSVCKALLAFDKDTANAILRYEPPEIYSLPKE